MVAEFSDGLKGQWRPRAIMEIEGLSLLEDVLISMVLVMQGDGGCYASNSYIAKVARCSERHVSDILSKLETAGHLVIKNRDGGSKMNRRIWVSEEIAARCGHVSSNACPDSALPPTPAKSKLSPTDNPKTEPATKKERKRNPTAEEHGACELPDFVPRRKWVGFVEMRHAEHGPFSERAAGGIIAELKRLHAEGYDAGKLLDFATNKCWRTIYDRPECKRTGSSEAADIFADRVLPDGSRIVNGRLIL